LETVEATPQPETSPNLRPVRVDPDLDLIRAIGEQAGTTFKRCFQCGTCSATCELSPDVEPFPRKEMAWAVWGRKDLLLADMDVWLCHQCGDCTERCPRSGRPGDVLAAVRRECVIHYAFPRFLARAVSQPRFLPLLLGIPATLLTLVILARVPLENALGLSQYEEGKISYSYTSMLPHWLLNGLFALVSLFVLLVTIVSVARFSRGLSRVGNGAGRPRVRGGGASLLSTLRRVFTHEDFAACGVSRRRRLSHLLVFFGFLGLTLVTLWVITSSVNPLNRGVFKYPFGFANPWKVLANAAGLAVLVGAVLMIVNRIRERGVNAAGTYFDWTLIWTILLVVITGFATEIFHYMRFEPHRHAVYFVHLVFVLSLILYLPYGKLAHVAYRTVALFRAERIGRRAAPGGKETP
jgi:quinone-modifying oxidoreductase subunit QmoC